MLLFLLFVVGGGCGRPEDRVVVFAAASVADVMERLGERYESETGRRVEVHSAASSMLAQQIARGARVDVVILANTEWMDWLAERGLIDAGSRRDLLSNSLVVVTPKSESLQIDFAGGPEQLGRKIAMGDPSHVPVGRYAEQALRRLGWWEDVEPNIVPAVDARAALRYVELGEVDSGIVYATDAMMSGRVEIAAEIPPVFHEPIVYPVSAGLDSGDSGELFLEYISTEPAGELFRDAGFVVIR